LCENLFDDLIFFEKVLIVGDPRINLLHVMLQLFMAVFQQGIIFYRLLSVQVSLLIQTGSLQNLVEKVTNGQTITRLAL